MLPPAFNPRRTVYGIVDRQFVPPVLRAFDFANPDLHIPQRSVTTVPQQALFFMNSSFLIGRAQALAHRPELASAEPAERIRRLYRITLQRSPTAEELDLGLRFVASASTEKLPDPPKPIPTAWKYGYGALDAKREKVAHFEPLPFFTGDSWQGGAAWPDAKLGWVRITADGGHAGNDLDHAAIRRWIAPRHAVFNITGKIRHDKDVGDGIRAHIVCSRTGHLATWTLHNNAVDVKLAPITVEQGDTIDFVVDYRDNLNNDDFAWTPVITDTVAAAGQARSWNAQKEFRGVPTAPPPPLSPWERYAQVLLLSNEFVFVD
jgi:hypothetical protein